MNHVMSTVRVSPVNAARSSLGLARSKCFSRATGDATGFPEVVPPPPTIWGTERPNVVLKICTLSFDPGSDVMLGWSPRMIPCAEPVIFANASSAVIARPILEAHRSSRIH
jgi:hypothetical protein